MLDPNHSWRQVSAYLLEFWLVYLRSASNLTSPTINTYVLEINSYISMRLILYFSLPKALIPLNFSASRGGKPATNKHEGRLTSLAWQCLLA